MRFLATGLPTFPHSTRLVLRDFCAILRTLNRRAELKRLVKWAIRKRLPGPRSLYQNRLLVEEVRLTGYTLRSRRLVIWARVAHQFNYMINPPPRYSAKGSAAIYRYRQHSKSN
jgi:hypothetical protein